MEIHQPHVQDVRKSPQERQNVYKAIKDNNRLKGSKYLKHNPEYTTSRKKLKPVDYGELTRESI